MQKFRKKPVVIEAVLWTGENVKEVLDFMKWRNASHDDFQGLKIHTLEGTHDATPGDWIIKGTRGEFYPCKPEPFADSYEPAEAAESWKKQMLAVQEAADKRLRPLLENAPGALGRHVYEVAAEEIERLREAIKIHRTDTTATSIGAPTPVDLALWAVLPDRPAETQG